MPPHADTFHSTPFHFFDPFVQCAWPTVTYYEWDLSFFYLFACFVNLFKTTLWFLRPFEPLLFILALSLSVSDDPLPAAAQKPKRNSREWNRSSFSFERVLLRLATLSNIICVPHVRLVVPYDLYSVCVCVCWNSYLQNSYFSFIYFRSYKL